MSHPLHVLVVRAAGLSWALPMDSVEQAFESGRRRVHDVAGSRIVVFRERALDVVDVAARLGLPSSEAFRAAVTVWAGGRRRAFGVEHLIGQVWAERQELPAFSSSRLCSEAVILDGGEIVPVLLCGISVKPNRRPSP